VLNFDLDLFEIYGSPGGKRSDTYASLHTFNPEVTQLSLNGFVSCGTTRLYIQNAALLSYSVEGYDDPDDEPVSIYLQTKQASRDRTYEIWFQLSGRPANGYKRFHDTFVWISTFGKHFIDFLGSYPGSTIGLRHFREDFFKWLKLRYNDGAYFRKWHKVFGKSDFRGQVNAYRDYLYGQAYNLENRDDLLRHQVWADCMVGGRLAIQQQPAKCHNTTTTPFVYEFFKDMYFGYCLENMDPVEAVLKELEGRKRELGFAKDSIQQSSLSQAPEEIHDLPLLRVGDVIGVPPDTYGPHRQSDEDWLAYIHRIEPLENGVQKLYVLWLYRPCDTVIRGTTYPIAKEVFMSDNCNDGDSEAALFSTEVLRVYSVEWWPQNLNTTKDLIIRQKYITQENSFVTLKRSDLSCECATPPTIDKYQPGDTIYIKRRGLLEPVVIQKINADSTVSVRILLRLKRDCLKISGISISHKVAENELVWTNEIEEVHVNEFKRKCHIRFFEKNIIINGNVPLPYNRRGNGDFWILSSKLVKADEQYERVELLSTAPHLLTQGPDLATPSPKRLIGLGIFSGSGNFDRGLEEGGAIDFRYSVDFSPEAIHTQRMNAKDPKKLCLYCGSVDDNLKAVLTGKNSKLIARIGTVHFICGGSPCPGFSILQLDPFGERSCRNASHITTICSYVDVYRPQYAVFENVVNMSVTRKGYESQNVFENVVACFVAMGYQVQYLIADAWSYSSSQSRERLCISIAAPGLEPMMHPWHSHSHPETVKARSLGKQFDGVSFGEREEHDVPFDFVTAGVSTSDLPDIGSGVTHACIPFPDHRLGASMSIKDRLIARCIPTFPPGQGYAEALARGLIPEAGNKVMAEVGRSFRRIKVDGLFPTITTNISVQNSRASGCLHWDQPRAISIQEARRAQGFPDSEVIIGSPIEQLKQVGNAVDRNVALALGLALRYA
ncbi:S-adenosyl-L-methionine-dependent methyltransferase, partial [Pleomassaria siparia CBS 279.74]